MKKIFTLALLAAFALVSCSQPEGPDAPETPQPQACDKHDVEWIATETDGLYFDNLYSESENVYNYSLIVSEHKEVYDIATSGLDLKPNSKYLSLDFFAAAPSANMSLSFTIPDGVYNLDVENTTAANTVTAEYTELIIVDADNNLEEIFFTSGTVTVAAGIIDALLIDDAGKVYHIQCPNKLVDNTTSWGLGAMPESVTTLTADLNVPFDSGDCSIYAEPMDDNFCVGKNCWYFAVDDWTSGDEFMFMLLVDSAKENISGTYPISNDMSKECALMGYPCAYTYTLMGAWYIHLNEEFYEDGFAALVSGSVTIDIQGDVASASVTAVDDLGHKLTGSCKNVEYIDASSGGWSLSKFSTGAKMAKHAKKQLAPRKVKASSLIKK